MNMNYNMDGPVMKRVVNVSNMKFKSRNVPLQAPSYEPPTSRIDTDLHNFQPAKDVTYAKTMANRNFDPVLYNFMQQTSELDIDENYTIKKKNPLFQSDETYDTDESEVYVKKVEPVVNGEKKTALELMFERIDLDNKKSDDYEKTKVSKIEVKYNENINTDFPESVDQVLDAQVTRPDDIYCQDSIYERITPDTDDRYEIQELKADLLDEDGSCSPAEQYNSINDNEIYQSLNPDEIVSHSYKGLSFDKEANDEEKYSISNFDAISMSSYTIQERKNSEISSRTIKIKKEMNDQFISLEIKPTDILYNIILAGLFQKYWIAGIKNSSVTLSSKIHFGDEVLSINDYLISDKESLLNLTKASVRPFINIKLKRLPYARVISLNNVNEPSPDEVVLGLSDSEILQRAFGIKLKHNTCKIEKTLDNGLFYRNGLKYEANKVEYDIGTRNTLKRSDKKDRLTEWVITEINGEYINYKCSAEEILVRLRANQVVCVIVQPYDLVKALFKEKLKYV